jgi:dipeptidyl aminopeptidase/acylaminoacyl peptidase
MRVGILLVFVVSITVACAEPVTPMPTIEASGITAAETSSQTPAPTPTLTVLPTATYTAVASIPTRTAFTIPRAPERPLSPNGPWILVQDDRHIYAANADGTGITPLLDFESGRYQQVSGISPHGGYFSFVSTGPDYDLPTSTLSIVSIPGERVVRALPLMNPAIDYLDPGVCSIDNGQLGQSVWSPDGKLLAYVGAAQGPTQDVYLYSVETDQVTRLTDGSDQSSYLSWSPDGKYIYGVGVNCFGTGAGGKISAVWAVTPAGDTMKLYVPSPLYLEIPSMGPIRAASGGETLVGWIDAHTFVAHSWSVYCGSYNLRSYNIETRQEHVYWPSCFERVMAEEFLNPSFVLDVWDYSQEGFETEPGIYLVTSDRSVRIAGYPTYARVQAQWAPTLGYYFLDVFNEPLRAFRPNATWVDLPVWATFVPRYVLENKYWVSATGDYLDITTGERRQLISGAGGALRIPGQDDFLVCAMGFYQVIAPEYQALDLGFHSLDCDSIDVVWP